MYKRPLKFAIAAIALTMSFSTPSPAKDLGDGPWAKERFQIRVRALDVRPASRSTVNIGGEVDAKNSFTPEIDVTYFFTPNIAAELIAATSKHKLKYTGDTALGEAWLLPPTLTLQYHFTPDKKFSPYIGAGLNYSIFYAEDAASGFTSLKVDNGLGYGLQAGVDYWINDNWGVNFDVKKLWLSIDATANNGTITADIDMDPWIIGTGISYRF